MTIERFEEMPLRSYDLCIIGSGPAGMTVASELVRARKGVTLCVLESGGREPTAFADQLRAVESEGIAIKIESRERVFGRRFDHLVRD